MADFVVKSSTDSISISWDAATVAGLSEFTITLNDVLRYTGDATAQPPYEINRLLPGTMYHVIIESTRNGMKTTVVDEMRSTGTCACVIKWYSVQQPHLKVIASLDYPGSVRWQYFSAPQICLGYEWSVVVTARAALRQIRVETLIGSQANYEKKRKLTIYFYKILIS